MNNTLDKSKYTNFESKLETNLEDNFNIAVKMSIEDYCYQALIDFLLTDKVLEKQIAVLKLNEIKSKNDAYILTSNLIGQDGKVREAVAFKINEFAQKSQYKDFFINEKIFDILIQGIMDINGNICRQIVDLANIIENFNKYLCNKLPEIINTLLVEIEKIDKTSKQYVISKRNFQLYWCLEALYNTISNIEVNEIKTIIIQCANFPDYTIREKTAKILAKINNKEFDEIKEILRNDTNYYVRRYLV